MRRLLVLLLALAAASASAQPQEVLFPGQTGDELRAALRAAYRPSTLLSDAAGKDRLYDSIDSTTVEGQHGVLGVYTGFFVPFDCSPSCDPSQDVFNQPNENTQGINQEHTYPQAFLNGSSSALAERDLHHLFPTKVNVNGARANFPFAEIPDVLTTTWYRDDDIQTPPPDASIIDEFSELRANTSFEPREVHEGNVARAMFYVQTIYDDEASSAFFTPQMETVYDWHYADPIDQAEYDRTFRVASFQDDTPNPFVLDSTLVRRAFFPEITTATEPALSDALVRLTAAPNPFRDAATLTLTLDRAQAVRVEVFDALGRRVARLHDGAAGAGRTTLTVDGTALPPGLYLVRVVTEGGTLTRRLVRGR